MVRDLGTKPDWSAVEHWNTEHPHVHLILRGKTSTRSEAQVEADRWTPASCLPRSGRDVWDAQTRLSIAACASADGKEVAATLEALKSLDLTGCVVTADALHCHAKRAAGIRATGARILS
jgi:hypothetical protein